MGIRNSAKAIVVKDNKVLLNKCSNPQCGSYYALPGGGQNLYETMEEAVVRECIEETGYTVVPQKLVGIYEEIWTEQELRESAPDYAHKIFHIFYCTLADKMQHKPYEEDAWQVGYEWIAIEKLKDVPLFPACIKKHIAQMLKSDAPLYLGAHRISFK